jgi:hypothetical protein
MNVVDGGGLIRTRQGVQNADLDRLIGMRYPHAELQERAAVH